MAALNFMDNFITILRLIIELAVTLKGYHLPQILACLSAAQLYRVTRKVTER